MLRKEKEMRKENHWKTSDIKLRKDSLGYYDAEHTHAGLLFETEYYPDRNSARRAAVKALKEKKGE